MEPIVQVVRIFDKRWHSLKLHGSRLTVKKFTLEQLFWR